MLHLTDDDKAIRAMVRRAMELPEGSAEYLALVQEVLINAKLAYGLDARERLKALITEVLGLQRAELHFRRRLDFG